MKLPLLFIAILVASVFANAREALRGEENAIWCGSVFLRGFDPSTKVKLSEQQVIRLADRLKVNNIKYVYIFAGPFAGDGSLPSFASSETARATIARLKKDDANLKVLAWIGGVENKTVHLENEDWLKSSARSTAELLQKVPFDGVHVDLEYVIYPEKSASKISAKSFREGWVSYFETVRKMVPRAFLSTSVVSTASGSNSWKLKFEIKDLAPAARYINQIVFMFYDTHIHDAVSYRNNMREQLKQIDQLKSREGSTTQYLFAIGAFNPERSLKAFRDIKLESLSYTLPVLHQLLNERNFLKNKVDGLAVYADWTMTPAEWAQIEKFHL